MSLILRPWKMSDLDSLISNANNPLIAQFMTDQFPFPYTQANGKKFIKYASTADPIHIFAIEVDSYAVGGIGIHPGQDIMRKNAELGYWLGEEYWGKGIISQAVNQMVTFAFKTFDIDRVFARPFGTNMASQKVLEKNGFILEGRFNDVIFKNGEYLDELIYAVRRNQWK
ncbi:MAG: GNAT family protein [Saprospiraceae bacterium]